MALKSKHLQMAFLLFFAFCKTPTKAFSRNLQEFATSAPPQLLQEWAGMIVWLHRFRAHRSSRSAGCSFTIGPPRALRIVYSEGRISCGCARRAFWEIRAGGKGSRRATEGASGEGWFLAATHVAKFVPKIIAPICSRRGL